MQVTVVSVKLLSFPARTKWHSVVYLSCRSSVPVKRLRGSGGYGEYVGSRDQLGIDVRLSPSIFNEAMLLI